MVLSPRYDHPVEENPTQEILTQDAAAAPPTSPADGSMLHIENLEMSGTMKFFCILLFLRGIRVILALLPLWQLWAIFFICIKPKWPPNCEAENQLLNYLP